MSDTLDVHARRSHARTLTAAVALSMLVHLLALWELRTVVRHPTPDASRFGEGRGPLAVQILPPPPVRAPERRAEPLPPAPRPAPRPRPPKTAKAPPRPAPAPPVIALDRPEAPPAAPQAARPPARAQEPDLSSYIEARRRARSEAAPSLAFPNAQPQPAPAEDANARANRLAAANLAPGRGPAFGYDPNRGGGIFSIQHVAYDYAEFLFYGWNREAKRNTAQLIEVRRGDHPDIRLAVVRRMIAIIREYEREEFLWESRRLGRYVTLSARPRDNDGLEDFMLAEFFDELRRVR